MSGAAGIVLAGGRSSRMGTPKAALEWHGSTLLGRAVAVLVRALGGPVLVVRALGQEVPWLPSDIRVVDDPAEDLGPLQGIAAGLAAAAEAGQTVAFVCATDLPFLHPAFVRHVMHALVDGVDVALPYIQGHHQPLAAGYRTAVAPVATELLAAGQRRLAVLFDRLRVRRLDDATLLADADLLAADPALDSVRNVNTAAEYAAARQRAAPQVSVDGRQVCGATLAAAVAAAGRPLDGHRPVWLNGAPTLAYPELPLVAGDVVELLPARDG